VCHVPIPVAEAEITLTTGKGRRGLGFGVGWGGGRGLDTIKSFVHGSLYNLFKSVELGVNLR
jgi:hypothetical protein